MVVSRRCKAAPDLELIFFFMCSILIGEAENVVPLSGSSISDTCIGRS